MPQQKSEPFRFTDSRQEHIYRRLRLVGDGPALFFRDACQLIVHQPALASTTHIVGHLMREIESAVRAVLSPTTIDKTSGEGNANKHQASIISVLKILEIPSEDPIAQLWLDLPGDKGLQSRVHRNALFPPRSVDSEFINLWEEFQAILEHVLQRFEEGYLKYHNRFEELAAKETPAQADLELLKQHAPHNPAAYRAFFNKASPNWLEPLRAKGFFEHPPAPVVEGDSVQFPPWSQSRYLQRLAKVKPKSVADTILGLPVTENVNVLTDLAQAACELPPEEAVRLVDKAKTWIDTPYMATMLLPDALGRMIVRLAGSGYVDQAIDLAQALLAVKPSSSGGNVKDPELAEYLHIRPEGRFRDWEYKEVLRSCVPALAVAVGLRALRLFGDLLNEALVIDHDPQEEETEPGLREDFSSIWRPAVEENVGDSGNEIVNPLVTAVRDCAKQIVIDDASRLQQVIDVLEGYRRLIFKRLALHILRNFHEGASDLVCKQLVNEVIVKTPSLHRDLMLLLQDAFPSLSKEQQDEVVGRIEEGPDLELLWEDIDRDKYARQWRWERLFSIHDYLSGQRAESWQQLEAEFGQEGAPQELGPVTFGWRSRATPEGGKKIASMSASEIVAFIKAFTPSKRFFGPSVEDLASELADAVSARPEEFSSNLLLFYELAPEDLSGLLRGFKRAAEAGRGLDWNPVLGLCLHVMDQPSTENENRWRRARREVVDLLHDCLVPKGKEIPFEFRDKVWAVLEKLIEDSDPTPDEEAQLLSTGPYHVAINSTRGRAMETVVFYGVWAYRHTKPPEGETFSSSSDVMHKLRAALERHLDPQHEPSLGVRSVYGVYLPHLSGLDTAWVEAHRPQIFPNDDEHDTLRKAAWEGYVCFSKHNLSMLELLRDEYQRSIDELGSPTLEERGMPEERLGQHLMDFYWHGKLDLRDPLMDRFFKGASDTVRGRTLGYVGRNLRSAEGPIEAIVLERIKSLWEVRVEASQDDGEDHVEEMASFGWWFASTELDDESALGQLQAALTISGKTEIDHEVVQRLLTLAPNYATATVECLRLMIDGATDEWRVQQWSLDAKGVLSAALKCDDEAAKQAARKLINRLVARGFLDFSGLIKNAD